MSEETKETNEVKHIIGQYTLQARNRNAPDPQKIVDIDRKIQNRPIEEKPTRTEPVNRDKE